MAARRNGKKQARRSGGSGGTPGWMYALGGLAVGLGIAGFLYFRNGGSVDDLLPKPNPAARAPVEPETPVAQDAPEPRKPKYDFYDVLRENEAVFPDAELNAQAAAEAQAAAATPDAPVTPDPVAAAPATGTEAAAPASGPRYLIQAGAFRSSTDADALKARIALTGEIARVESAEIAGGTIYRVRLGPYPNASTLAAAKQALGNHGIEAVAIRAQ